jgi:hypothetical protein
MSSAHPAFKLHETITLHSTALRRILKIYYLIEFIIYSKYQGNVTTTHKKIVEILNSMHTMFIVTI